jgi:hypothetical protein
MTNVMGKTTLFALRCSLFGVPESPLNKTVINKHAQMRIARILAASGNPLPGLNQGPARQ